MENDTDVSIHAPAGGATEALRQLVDDCQVSIHAPAGGATGHIEQITSL